jgi:hypothetical protein
VLREVPEQIDSSRAIGADGQSFFRYDHVSNPDILEGRYASRSFVPAMEWKDPIPPEAPSNLAVSELEPRIFHLEWLPSPPAADGDTARYYIIYRSPSGRILADTTTPPVEVVPSRATFYVDTVETDPSFSYYYAVAALDRGNNVSALSNVAGLTIRELTDLRGKLSGFTTLSMSHPYNNGASTLIAYRVALRARVSLSLERKGADSIAIPPFSLAAGPHEAGTYVVAVEKQRLQPGSYIVRLIADDVTIEQQLDVQR